MTLTDIQNLPLDELKARRDELVAAAAKENAAELAKRCVQNLIDAKMRDVTLGEQGKTIAAQTETIELQKKLLADAEANVTKLASDLAESRTNHANDCAAHGEQCAKLQSQAKEAIGKLGHELTGVRQLLAAESARATRNSQLAARSEVAINAASRVLNDAISLRTAEKTNEGA